MPKIGGLVFSRSVADPGGGRRRQRVEGARGERQPRRPAKRRQEPRERSEPKAKDFFLLEGSCSGANQSRADRRRRESYDNRCNVVAVYAICYPCDGDGVNARLRFQPARIAGGRCDALPLRWDLALRTYFASLRPSRAQAVRCSTFAIGSAYQTRLRMQPARLSRGRCAAVHNRTKTDTGR